MELTILGCSGGLGPGSRLTSVLVDDRLLVDAGHLAVAGLERVEALLLTHAHLDHVLHLPMLLTAGLAGVRPTLEIWAEAETIERVRGALLCDRVYPDHSERVGMSGEPVGQWRPLGALTPRMVAGYEVTPLRMAHEYPCVGYAIRQPGARGGVGAGAIVAGDTSDSLPLWEFANAHPWVQRVLVEVSFPDELSDLAADCGHLTPQMLEAQLAGLRRRNLAIDAVHLKPELEDAVRRQLRARLGDRVRVAQAGEVLSC